LQYSLLVTPQNTVQRIAQYIQQNMQAAGVQMSIVTKEQAALITAVILGQYQASGFILFGNPTLDTNYVFIANNTIAPVNQLALNFTRYNDPVLTDALNRARTTDNSDQQIADYKVVQEQFAKNLTFIFWTHDLQSIAYGNNVHGLTGYKLPDGQTALTQIVPLTFAAWKS
jgi:ABC-type transport system substrate-binding protein